MACQSVSGRPRQRRLARLDHGAVPGASGGGELDEEPGDVVGGAQRHGILAGKGGGAHQRSEEHTSELQSLMPISYAVFCLIKKHLYFLFISLSPIFSHI